ncbi:unnamed protein product, partial [Brenthis ino]
MTNPEVVCKFYFEDIEQNRKMLFNKSIAATKNGRVLYILPEELNELPQLSQDLNQIDRHYMKMITFIYAPCIKSLLEAPQILFGEDTCDFIKEMYAHTFKY